MNIQTLKQSLKSPDIRYRLLIIIGIIGLYRVLAHVPVPIADPQALQTFLENIFQSNRLLGFADLFSGGALANFSIVLMSLGPYINASIIMQLLGQVVPKIKELQKEGESGRRKVNQYTRLLTVPLAMGQAVGSVFLIRRLAQQSGQLDIIGSPTFPEWILIVTSLTAGAILLMWLGELISEQGIGNGISLLITASIITQLPGMVGQFLTLLQSNTTQVTTLLGFVIAAVVTTYFIVILNEGQRRITVSYAKRVRGSQGYGGVESTLPVRVITAGVIPIIFAVAFLSVPSFVGQLFTSADTAWLASFAQKLTTWYSPQHTIYGVTYFSLVIVFTYFYTGVVFNPDDIAENLQKQGGFIPGIRPGKQTANYLRKVINRITLFGSISLGLVAVLPFIAERITGNSVLTFGGTGLLIVVSVGIQFLRQLESQTVMAAYE